MVYLQILEKKFMNKLKKLLLLLVVISVASCASRKDLAYMQNADSVKELESFYSFEPTLKVDDLLSIIVSAETPEVTIPFNLPQIQGNYQIGNNQNGIKTYLIDAEGFIDFPVVGSIQLAGLSRTKAVEKLEEAVAIYIINPSINLRILNYKVSIIGEVAKPGNYPLQSERITLIEALSMAGDLTIYGRRDNILVIREVDGKRSFNRVDITSADFINSPYYYLTQNDQIVVEPNKARMNASAVGPNIPIFISALSILVSLSIILFR